MEPRSILNPTCTRVAIAAYSDGTIDDQDLADDLAVTRETIRRSLATLANLGALTFEPLSPSRTAVGQLRKVTIDPSHWLWTALDLVEVTA
jgi:DNA-binding FadR family transcriptional regulator